MWVGRTSQVLGLGIMAFETASTRLFGPADAGERPWLMLFATAMILGGVGLNILLRAMVARMQP